MTKRKKLQEETGEDRRPLSFSHFFSIMTTEHSANKLQLFKDIIINGKISLDQILLDFESHERECSISDEKLQDIINTFEKPMESLVRFSSLPSIITESKLNPHSTPGRFQKQIKVLHLQVFFNIRSAC